MNCSTSNRSRFPQVLAAAGALLVALTGCKKPELQVYRVPKEQRPMAASAMPQGHPETSGAAAGGGSALPKVTYKAPENWEEVPAGEMRAASFRVKGEGGKVADFGIVPLPGLAGGDLGNVNRWRSQVGLGPITNEVELAKEAQPAEIAGQKALVFEMAGEDQAGDASRIIAAIQRRDGVAWFFKLVGPESLVATNKAAFFQFLKSVSFEAVQPDLPPSHPPIDGASMAAQAFPGGEAAGQGKPTWQVPAGWQEVPGGQFLVAKFNIAGPDNSQAAVNVSMSAGDGGGLAGNVNRWRRQVGLGELPEADIAKAVTKLETAAGAVSLVDITGTDPRSGATTRLVGAVLAQSERSWFYKLMGNEQLVERERENFTKFIQSAKYPNAS